MLFRNKFKKIGAMAVTAMATVAATGTGHANVPPMMNMISQSSVQQTNMLTGFGLPDDNKNINIGSYQTGRNVEITIGQETGQKVSKLGLDSLVKKYDVAPQLGVDALIKEIAEEAKKQKYNADVDAAFEVANGRRSPYGSVGCAETVTYAGSYYSPALKDAFYKGIAYVPSLLADLSSKGFAIEPFDGFAEKGDLLVYGDDDHITISDGRGGCFGNSSSRLHAMYYSNAANAWNYGELPSKVVRMTAE